MSEAWNQGNVSAHNFDVRDLWDVADWSPEKRGVKAAIDLAAQRTGFKHSRVYEIWYRRARRIEDHERARIAEALAEKRKRAALNELHELRTRLVRLESMLAQQDADFHRPSIDAARDLAGGLRGAIASGRR